ncbi:MAG: hypothetical protein KF799_08510 [Bdellovibrionales bacterium]|nr:hypothetical protein [Bdellovibrionales bacterium]
MRAIEFSLLLTLVLSTFPLFASEEKPHAPAEGHESERMAEHNARTSSRDVKIPRALVGKIEEEYKAYLTKLEGGAKREAIKRALININAELTQKHPGALHENTRISTPTGGGVVDLSEMVTPVRGAFRLKLVARKENGSPLTTARVFFVSRAKTRILAGEEYGAGCDKYMDISTQFHKKWEKGMDLYTADQRYLSVIGGTFIFAEYDKDALYVGSVTFTDSRHPGLLCE